MFVVRDRESKVNKTMLVKYSFYSTVQKKGYDLGVYVYVIVNLWTDEALTAIK